MNLRKQGIKLITSLPFSVFSKLEDGKMKVEMRHNSSFLCWFSILGRLGSKKGLRVSWILFSSLPYSLLFRLFLYPGPASHYPVLSSCFIILEQPGNRLPWNKQCKAAKATSDQRKDPQTFWGILKTTVLPTHTYHANVTGFFFKAVTQLFPSLIIRMMGNKLTWKLGTLEAICICMSL